MASNGEAWAFPLDGQENLHCVPASVSMVQSSFYSSLTWNILVTMVQQRGKVEYNWQVFPGFQNVSNDVACTVALGPVIVRQSGRNAEK